MTIKKPSQLKIETVLIIYSFGQNAHSYNK